MIMKTKNLKNLKGQNFVKVLECKSTQAVKGGTISTLAVVYLLYKGVKALV